MVKGNKRRKLGIGQQIFLILIVLLAAAFLGVSIVMFIGMLPTIVAVMVDVTRDKTRSLTISLLNFSACFPFLLTVGVENNSMAGALDVLSEPVNIVIMYAGAAAGYFLDWTCAGISNVIMSTRARQRIEEIKKREQELVRRWGKEVTGEIPLDADGFPIEEGSTE